MEFPTFLKELFSPNASINNEVIYQLASMGCFSPENAPGQKLIAPGDDNRWKYVLFNKYYENYKESNGEGLAVPIAKFSQFMGSYFNYLLANSNQRINVGSTPATLRVDDAHIKRLLSPYDRDNFSIKSIVNAHPSQYVLSTEDLSLWQRLNNMMPSLNFGSASTISSEDATGAAIKGGNIKQSNTMTYKLFIKYFIRSVLIDFFNVRSDMIVRAADKRIINIRFNKEADEYNKFLAMYEQQIKERGTAPVEGWFANLYKRLTGANFFANLYSNSLNTLTWLLCFFNYDKLQKYNNKSFQEVIALFDGPLRMEFALKASGILLKAMKSVKSAQPNAHLNHPVLLLLLLENISSNKLLKEQQGVAYIDSIQAEKVDYLREDPLRWSMNSEGSKNTLEFSSLDINKDIYNHIAEQSDLVQRLFMLAQTIFNKMEHKLKNYEDTGVLDEFAKGLFLRLEKSLEHSKNRLFFKKYFGFSNSLKLYPLSVKSLKENVEQLQFYVRMGYVEFNERAMELPLFVSELLPKNLWNEFLQGYKSPMPFDSFDLSPLKLSAEVLSLSRFEKAEEQEYELLNPLYTRNDLSRNENKDLLYKNEKGEKVVINDDLAKMTPERLRALHYTFQILDDEEDAVAYKLYRAAVVQRSKEETLAALCSIKKFGIDRMHLVHPKFALNVLQALGFKQVRAKGQRYFSIEDYGSWYSKLGDSPSISTTAKQYIQALIHYINANPIIINKNYETTKQYSRQYPTNRKIKALSSARPIQLLSSLFNLQARRRNALQYLKMQGGRLYACARTGVSRREVLRGGNAEEGDNQSKFLIGTVGSHIQLPYVVKQRGDLDMYAEIFTYYTDKMKQLNITLDSKTHNDIVRMINGLKRSEMELQDNLRTLEQALLIISANPAALSSIQSNQLSLKSLNKIIEQCNSLYGTCNAQTTILNSVFSKIAKEVETRDAIAINDSLGGKW